MNKTLEIIKNIILVILIGFLAYFIFFGRDIPDNQDNGNIDTIKKELKQYKDSIETLHKEIKEKTDSLNKKVARDTVIIKQIYNEKADSIIELDNNQSIELFSKYVSEVEFD